MGTMSYGWDAMDEIVHQLSVAFSDNISEGKLLAAGLHQHC